MNAEAKTERFDLSLHFSRLRKRGGTFDPQLTGGCGKVGEGDGHWMKATVIGSAIG